MRNKLKLAVTGRDVKEIVNYKDGKCSSTEKSKEIHTSTMPNGRLIAQTPNPLQGAVRCKKRFVLHPIDVNKSAFKLCKVIRKAMGPNKIPYIITHDGRTIRFPDNDVKAGDSVKLNLETGKIVKHVKMEAGMICYITGGNSCGRVGEIIKIERHLGSYDIVTLKDQRGERFITRSSNVFPIGVQKQLEMTLPKGNGVKLSPMEEKAEKITKAHGKKEAKKE